MEPDPYKTSVSLIQAIKDQCDASSWERFYHIYHPLLFRYSCSLGLSQTDAEDLVPFCRRYVEDLAAKGSPTSYAVMKRQIYAHHYRGLGAAETEAQRLMVESFGRPDFAEGVASFVERRPPEFPRVGRT